AKGEGCYLCSHMGGICYRCLLLSVQTSCATDRQLANVLEIAKWLSLQAAKGAGRERLCGEHQEALKLFCEEDRTSVCVVCHLSRAHRAHTVVPLAYRKLPRST
ncbi:unnamed protein product, partial [Caretta caretta]